MMQESETQRPYAKQAEMLANRVKKRYRHLIKRFTSRRIEVFRLYDWDIPEIRAVVDWYAGHLVVGEYTRKQSTHDWLPAMGAAVADALCVSRANLHLKQRFYGKPEEGRRYERIDTTDRTIVVSERELKFHVNPWDYVDTGLFGDHRNTRQMVRELAVDKNFLNLFCYTGAFTCYAAIGGARSSVSVDRSKTAVNWARQNLILNSIDPGRHQVIQTHAFDFLSIAKRRDQRFDLAVVDPPSFYTRESHSDHFDIVRDHPKLLDAVAAVMNPGGIIFFSTNHQNFTPGMETVAVSACEEITSKTIPEDYQHKHKTIHRCWKLVL